MPLHRGGKKARQMVYEGQVCRERPPSWSGEKGEGQYGKYMVKEVLLWD